MHIEYILFIVFVLAYCCYCLTAISKKAVNVVLVNRSVTRSSIFYEWMDLDQDLDLESRLLKSRSS